MNQHTKGFFVRHFGLRGIAVFEAAKGSLAFVAAILSLVLRHKDMRILAEDLLRLFHLALDHDSSRWLLRMAGRVTPRDVALVSFGLLVYAAVRFTEAAGLWLEKEWAEWFALLSGAMYMPFEIAELVRHPTGWKWGIIVLNLLIVLYLAGILLDSYKRRKLAREQGLPVDVDESDMDASQANASDVSASSETH